MTSDTTLLLSLSTGDEKAFKALYDKYYSLTVKFVMDFIRDEDVAERVIELVWIHVWDARTELPYVEDFKIFLYLCVKSEALKQLKIKNV